MHGQQNYELTGKYGHKKSFFGKMILMVEYRYPSESPGEWEYDWKEASIKDFLTFNKLFYEKTKL